MFPSVLSNIFCSPRSMRVTVVRSITLVHFVEWDPKVFYQIVPSGAGLFAWATVQRKTNPSAKTSFVVRVKQVLKVLARLGLLWPQSFLCKLQGRKWHLFPKWAKDLCQVLSNTTLNICTEYKICSEAKTQALLFIQYYILTVFMALYSCSLMFKYYITVSLPTRCIQSTCWTNKHHACSVCQFCFPLYNH